MMGRVMDIITLVFHSGCLHLWHTAVQQTHGSLPPVRGEEENKSRVRAITSRPHPPLVSLELFDHFDLFKQNNSPCVYGAAPQVAPLSVLFIYF